MAQKMSETWVIKHKCHNHSKKCKSIDLYEIAEPVSLEDIHPHPKVKAVAPGGLWEWLTQR
jgi:hypothetical protein